PLAVKCAVFLYNLSPHSALANEKSPVKCLFPNSKDFLEKNGKLHSFGSVAYRWIHHEERNIKQRGKFAPNSEQLVFVGYDSLDSTIYRLLDMRSGVVIRERNVTILDGNYPFCDK